MGARERKEVPHHGSEPPVIKIKPGRWRIPTVRDRWVEAVFVLIGVCLLGAWAYAVRAANADSVRAVLVPLLTSEGILLSLLFTSLLRLPALIESQAKGLDSLRDHFASQMAGPGVAEALERALRDQVSRVNQREKLDSTQKCKDLHHLSDDILVLGLHHLLSISRRHPTIGGGSDSARFFHAACGFFLCPVRLFGDPADPLRRLAENLSELNQQHEIVQLVNNIYDQRQAARRGMSLFTCYLALAWLASFVGLFTIGQRHLGLWLGRVAMVQPFLIALVVGYYVVQIPGRYILGAVWKPGEEKLTELGK